MKYLGLVFLFVFSFNLSRAVEGMLIPTVLEAFESDMKAMGMKLSAKDIFDANNASIKDAIMHFGGGCTSELVSSKGLLLTNHHCGYSQINSHSTLENNILKNGFWAKTLNEELPNKGLSATRMVNIVDVTDRVLEGTEELSEVDAQRKIQANIARLKAEYSKDNHYDAEIKPFDFGNSYYLLLKETFLDVRLVGTPPNTIGKFGGDTDNWVWPRHTGDFAVFRVYAGQDNLPAEYSEDNKPYSPIHFLPISLKDKKDGDFTMVFGFPGRTEQHTISTELDYIINDLRPAQIRMRDESLAIINAAMRQSEYTTLQYASKQARIANAWKKWIGQIDGLKRANAVQLKQEYESNYLLQSETNDDWKQTYEAVVDQLVLLTEKYKDLDFAYNLFIEYTYVGAEFMKQARSLKSLIDALDEGKSEDEINELKQKLIGGAENFYKNYDPRVDKAIFEVQSELYRRYLATELLPNALLNQDLIKLSNNIFRKSILTDEKRWVKFIEKAGKSSPKKIRRDPGFVLFNQLDKIFHEKLLDGLRAYYGAKNALMKTYVKGKYEMFPEDKHWSDANGTLRVTYGKLEGSIPRDGMKYTPYTTLSGIIEKYNPGQEDFDLLPRMLDLYESKNYKGYDQDGELWICFTGSNHTTGGNSGSPVINAEGHLMGLNFDRSWESTMSDFLFDADRCRNITVDIRYVLWVIDVYGEAGHLIQEMKLIKN